MNLVQNAIQAMDGRGRVTVNTGLRRRPRSTWAGAGSATGSKTDVTSHDRLPTSRPENEVIEIAVRDTGPGISQTIMKNLFVPFFTTKAQGTGLGLAISQSIIRNAGGLIDVQSQSGAGTTFLIVLPVSTDLLPSLTTPAPTPATGATARS
jgi:signal transduction histidine kinase